MKKVFTIIGIIFSILVVGYLGLNWWTESKHDMPAHQWIQELTDKDNKKETTDSTVEDEIEVESEDGTEATATFSL